MESCGICFEVREGDEKAGIEAEYIAPDLLPERNAIQTELDALWERDGPIEQVLYEFDLLLPRLLRAVTWWIGGLAGVSALYWRDGLCVYEASTGAHALIEQQMDAGWSGRIVVSTRGRRARALLEWLQQWVEAAQSQIGFKPRKSAYGSPTEIARRHRGGQEAEEVSEMRFAAAPRTTPRWYVSYAWNDPADSEREKDVDRTCAAAEARGAPIVRDRTAMNFGELDLKVHEGHWTGRPRLRLPQRQIPQVAVLHVRAVRDLAQQPVGQGGIQVEGAALSPA